MRNWNYYRYEEDKVGDGKIPGEAGIVVLGFFQIIRFVQENSP